MIDYQTLLASILGQAQQKPTMGFNPASAVTGQKAPINLTGGTIPTAGEQSLTAGSTVQNYGGYVSPDGQNTGSPVAAGGSAGTINYQELLKNLLAKLLGGRM